MNYLEQIIKLVSDFDNGIISLSTFKKEYHKLRSLESARRVEAQLDYPKFKEGIIETPKAVSLTTLMETVRCYRKGFISKGDCYSRILEIMRYLYI